MSAIVRKLHLVAQDRADVEPPIQQTDPELMARLAAGDTTALQDLYDRYGQIAYALALRLTRLPAQAEDVVQDAFLALWRQATRFNAERGVVRTWLLSIIHHRCVDILRSARYQREHNPDDEVLLRVPDVQDVESEVVRRLEARRVRAALGILPDNQRQIVELAYFEGFAYPEIAQRLGIPLGTVKSRLRIALGKLRTVIGPNAPQAAVS